MTEQPQLRVTPAAPPQAWTWGKSLGAATWPTLCALGVAAYAFFPERFPAQTGLFLCLLIPAEIPTLFIGVAQAAALTETTLLGRMKAFFLVIGVALAMLAISMGMEMGWREMLRVAPLLFWVLVPYVIGLIPNNSDPALNSRQAEAVLEDKLHLIALIPVFVIGGLLLILATLALLAGISMALGTDLIGKLTEFVEAANPSLLALVGSAYLLIGAASAAHVHRPVFLLQRKALLDQPWINKLNLPQSSGRRRRRR